MRAAVFILVVFGATSCCPRGAAVRSFRGDSVRVERSVELVERWRDTTVYLSVPAENREALRRDSSLLETSVAVSLARIEADGSLFHSLRNREQTKPVVVPVKDIRLTEKRDSVVVREMVREIAVAAPLSWWQKFWQRSGQAAWGVLALIAGVGLLRRKVGI